MDVKKEKPPPEAWEIGAFPHSCPCGKTHWYRPAEAIGAAWPCGVAVLTADGSCAASKWWQALLSDHRQRLMDG